MSKKAQILKNICKKINKKNLKNVKKIKNDTCKNAKTCKKEHKNKQKG